MLTVDIAEIGDVAVVECRGRIVRSEAAFKLRNAVTSQTRARIVVLDLTEVYAIEGGGLGMLRYLQRWAQDHHLRLKLFDPAGSINKTLLPHDSTEFDFATFDEMVALLVKAGNRYGVAA